MNKDLRFNKGFLPSVVVSTVLILFGVIGFVTKGINLGLDFKPGLLQEVRIAPVAVELSYTGTAKVNFELSSDKVDIVISGTGADNITESFSFVNYPTVNDLANAINKMQMFSAVVKSSGEEPSRSVFINSAVSNQLSKDTFYVYAKNQEVSIDEVRESLKDVSGISVKEIGDKASTRFQIRMSVSSDESTGVALQKLVTEKLSETFGQDKVSVVKTDFIGSSFSKSLALKSVLLLVLTIFCIWVYAAIRFHWDFALGSVVALLHDVLIMLSFIVWTQMEFTTTVLAALLTIVGYSINATVVILDRIRHNLGMLKVTKFDEIINKSLSDTLTRSILTTLTTLFAVVSLYIFTTGSIKDFALAVIVGLLSGCYSSIFIMGSFVSFSRRNWKPEFGVHHSEKSHKKGVLEMDSGVTV